MLGKCFGRITDEIRSLKNRDSLAEVLQFLFRSLQSLIIFKVFKIKFTAFYHTSFYFKRIAEFTIEVIRFKRYVYQKCNIFGAMLVYHK